MITIESTIGDLKSGPRWAETDIDTGITGDSGPASSGLATRLLRSIWHAFRDGAAMYAASYCGALDPGIEAPEPHETTRLDCRSGI